MGDLHNYEPVLLTIALYLAALVTGLLVFRRLGLGVALGYLAVGAIAGPTALGLLGGSEAGGSEAIESLAEFGIVLFLFVIGLELRPGRLWRLRIDLVGLGGAQLVITTLVLASGFRFGLDWSWAASVVVGSALSLSSTAFGVQLLGERGAVGTPFGDRAISILLFQDIALVPLIALAALFSQAGFVVDVAAQGGAVLVALGSLGVLVLVGHFAIGPFFRLIARSGVDDAFTAGALLVVAAAALLMRHAGLSMAMGGVIAGVLLADSQYRHRIEAAVDPFRGLLIGVFFVGVGASIDWGVVLRSFHIALGGAVALFLIKGVILLALVRIRGARMAPALRTAALLGQSGEFSFVLFGLGVVSGALPSDTASVLTAVAALSMALTPLAMMLADRWIASRTPAPSREAAEEDAVLTEEGMPAPTILVGCGRFGQTVAEVLKRRGHELLMIDSNAERVRVVRSQGHEVVYGELDEAFLNVVVRRGVRAFFVCIDDAASSLQVVSRVRGRFPDALILVRTEDRLAQWEAVEVGADFAVREVFESALSMARAGLEYLGDKEAAEEVIEEFRREDAERFDTLQARYTRDEPGLEASPPDAAALDAEDEEDGEVPPVPTRRRRPFSFAPALERLRSRWQGRTSKAPSTE